jgi:A/G-specific adenine glycosylase
MIAPASFTKLLLEWFSVHGRKLPWRENPNPYKVWVSEIMLQQTQVSRVEKHFYPIFLKKFPTLQLLSQCDWETLYPIWKGLGYYQRGKNMLQTAQIVVKKFQGKFPRDIKVLQSLPGIGIYTAQALLSFAWDQKIPAIDTNIQRIISTLWPRKNIEKMASELISHSTSGRDWNGAMMDLASALRAGEVIPGNLGEFFPEKVRSKFLSSKKTSSTKSRSKKWKIEVGIACIHKNGKYLIQTRPKGKSFVGYWEFPGGKREPREDFRTCVKREIQEELGIEISVRPHFYEEICQFNRVNLLLRFHRCQIQKGIPKPLENQKIDWIAPQKFDSVQFLKTNAKALEKLKKMRS